MSDDEGRVESFGRSAGGIIGFVLIGGFGTQYILPLVNPILVVGTIGAAGCFYFTWHSREVLNRKSLSNHLLMIMELFVACAGVAIIGFRAEAYINKVRPTCDKLFARMVEGEVAGDVADTYAALRCPPRSF